MKKEIVYLMLTFLFAAGSASGFLLLLPFFVRDLHFSFTQAGFIAGAFNFSRIFLVIPLTALSKKIGAIKMLLIGTAIYATGFILVGFQSVFLSFVVLFFFIGMAISVFQPLVFGLSTRLAPEGNRGKVMGFVTSGSDLGRIAIASVISFAATRIGWRISSIGAGCLVFLFLFYAYLRQPKLQQEIDRKEKASLLDETKILLKNTQFLLTSLIVFFDSIASATLFVYLPFLMIYRHMSLFLVPLIIVIFFIGSIMGKLYLGKLIDTFPNTLVFLVAEGLMGIFLIIIAHVTLIIPFAIISFILGVLTKGTVPASLTMAAESIGEGNFEHGYAVNYIVLSIANTLTPILVGFVADHSNVSTSFYVCAFAAFFATIPALIFHKVRQQRQIESALVVEKEVI